MRGRMPVRNDGIICHECGGSGCSSCNQSGYSYRRSQEPPQQAWADLPDVPMPYGKILPDLTDCYYINLRPDGTMNQYLDIITCPNCDSDNVVVLSKEHNPDIAEEQEILAERFFCISCQDSWCYERER